MIAKTKHLYGDAFTSGLHVAVLIAGIVTLAAAALAFLQARPKPTNP